MRDFIGATAAFLILGAFGLLALRGAWVSYKDKHYVVSVCGLLLGGTWLSGALVTAYHIIIPWLLIGSVVAGVWYWKNAPERGRDIIGGIFGWFVLILLVLGIALSILESALPK